MAVWRRSGRKHSGSRVNDSIFTDTDGPLRTMKQDTPSKKQLVKDNFPEMLPDKELEERVLCDCSEYLANNLPADDVASVMLSKSLLTSKEHDEYKAMKRSGRSTMTCMSEYLLECLRKREAGFLKKFSGILWEIEPAKYLSDYIQRAYREASLHGGFNTHSRDRLSKISISDPDIRPKTPQGNTTTSCTSCKTLKRQNRQLLKFNSELKEQLIELNKDYHQLLEAKIKVEGQLEVLQDQLHEETAEKKNLKQIVPDLQRAISLIENSCRVSSATATSGAQQTLSRIRDLMREQSKYEKPTTVLKRRHIRVHPSDSSKRDSTLSMFSDTSSVAEGSLADEDVIQRHSSDSLSQVLTPEQNRLGMDVTKPVVSDLHRSLTYSPTPFTNQPIIRRDINEPSGHVQATENTIQAPKLMLATVQGHSNQSAQEIPHDHEHVRSESSPTMDVFSTSTSIKSYDQPNTNPRKTRHYSVPEVPTIKGRSQSFRQESRAKPSPSQYRIQTDVRTQGDARDNELSAILSKIREKVDSESETLKQNLTQ